MAEKRSWQCFVCGHRSDEYGDYCSHIISEHDECRDYVLCPVDTCKCPVRCLTTHFKVKHKNRVMPKNIQNKATIWRDISPNKKIRTRKPNFKEGYFHSQKNGGKDMYYRSGYERDVYQCLEIDDDVKAFTAEPFRIPYYFNNEWHNYTPDLKLEYVDGVVDIWEIKPATQIEAEQNKAKWKSMNAYAEQYGWNFTVITETGINLLKRKVRQT